jgi:hypothetical protein
VRIKVRAIGAAVVLATVAVGLVGCGGNDDGTDAAASGNGFQAYLSCLSEHGVTLQQFDPGNRPTDQPQPDPSRLPGDGQGPGGQGPGGQGGFLGEQAPDGVDQATWDAARTACESVRPTGGPGQGGPRGGNDSAFAAYRNCLADHGVTATQRPDDLNTDDPTVAAAVEACAVLRPTEAPRPQPTE